MKPKAKHTDLIMAIVGVLIVALGVQSVRVTVPGSSSDVTFGVVALVFGGMLVGAAISKSAAARLREKETK